MRDELTPKAYNFVIITLDRHVAGPAARVAPKLAAEFPGLNLIIHAGAEWGKVPNALQKAKDDIAEAHIVINCVLFLEEHIKAIMPDLQARRDACDAMVGVVSDQEITQLTKMGDLDMSRPAENMVRFLVSRYAQNASWNAVTADAPVDYPEVGLYHPDLPGDHITTDLETLPGNAGHATIGILMLRSYILSGDTAHYDHVIRRFEARGLRVILTQLDVPYIAAQPLEFQTLEQWAKGDQGLSPVEATMLVALPEIDGATNPTVFAGRHGGSGCSACAHQCDATSDVKAMAPCLERVDALVEKADRLATLRRKTNAQKTVGIVAL